MTGTAHSWATELYRLLPEVYRSRDGTGDLHRFVAACGDLLDLIRQALDQRLADSHPDHPRLQGWLLPYVAALVDARLASPDEDGRRVELAQTVAWRQRKGTVHVLGPIVRAVGRYDLVPGDGDSQLPSVAIVEGFTRVAVTPRIGASSPRFYRPDAVPLSVEDRAAAVRAPGLPVALVDFRYRSRKVLWGAARAPLQLHVHGVPAYPGTSEDVSRRTPDLRPPTFRTGHFHPRSVIGFVVPRSGFFPPDWDSRYPLSPLIPGDGMLEGRTLAPDGGHPVSALGPLTMQRCVVRGDLTIEDGQRSSLTDCIVTGTLRFQASAGGALRLERCAVGRLLVAGSPDRGAPVATITNSLLQTIESTGWVQLVGTTILDMVTAATCQVSDSLLAGAVLETHPSPESCFRFSRLPPELFDRLAGTGQVEQCTTDAPLFKETLLGKPGCGVLHAACTRLRSGAENGGEVGAFNHRNYALCDRAVTEKLLDHLPHGMRVALVPDPRLLQMPPGAPDLDGATA